MSAEALGLEPRQDRRDHRGLLAAHGAAFAGVGVEAGDGDARRGEGEVLHQGGVGDAERGLEKLGRQRPRHVGDGDVDGHRHHAQQGRRQHHHRQRRAGEMREELGVAGEGEAGAVLERLLVDRVGAERQRRAAADQLHPARDDGDDRGGVLRVRPAGLGGRGSGCGSTGSPAAMAAAASAGAAIGRTGTPRRAPSAAMWSASPIRKKASRSRSARPGLERDLGPDPRRVAERQRDRAASSLDDDGVAEQFLEIALAEAGDALGEEPLAQRLAHLGIVGVDGLRAAPAGSRRA